MAHIRSYPFPPEDLKRLAITDELTGLYNRRFFLFRLNEEMERARRSDREVSLLLMDLDGLKAVNDMYGHLRGDRLLVDFAEILSQSVRPFDVVARYAGDEFIILLPESNADEASRIADRIRRNVAEAVFRGDPPLKVTTSIGIAVFPENGDDAEHLIEAADRGLYTAKRDGRNRYSFPVSKEKAAESSRSTVKTSRLVGRDEELFLMSKALSNAVNGRSAFILITGEPGVGRSRLLSEFQKRAEQVGALTLAENCFEQSRFIPYHPIREALRSFFSHYTQKAYRTMLELTEIQRFDFLSLLPDLEPGRLQIQDIPVLTREKEEFHLFDAISHYFRCLAESSPLVLLLDDIQWLDETTGKLLIYLLRNFQNQRFLFAATYREGEAEDTSGGRMAISRWIRTFKSVTNMITISLQRLNRARTREMVHALLGQVVPVSFTDLIHNESEGNPFFIEEIIKSMLDRRILVPTESGWSIEEIDSVGAPEPVREMIVSRLENLDDEEKQVLTVGAVIGRLFDFDTIQIVTGRNEGHLLDVLERLEKALLIKQRPSREGERYQFTHNKIRQVLYETLDPRRCRTIHQRVAQALERLHHGNIELIAGELAGHYLKARMPEQAVRLYLKAGDKARSLHAESETMRYYTNALTIIRKNPEKYSEELGILQQKMAIIYRNQGDSRRAIKALREAIAVGRSSITTFRQAQIHRQIAEILIDNGRFNIALKELRLAENMLNPDQDKLELTRIEICKCALLLNRGEYEACLEEAERCMAALKNTSNVIELSDIYDICGEAEYFLGHRNRAVKLFSDSLELRRQAEDLPRISRSYSNLARIFLEAGRWNDAAFWYNKGIKIDERLGRYISMADPHANLARLYLMQGKLEKAETHIQQALEINENACDIPATASCLAILMHIQLEDGRIEEAKETITKAERIHAKHEIGVVSRDIIRARAYLELYAGNVGKAETIIDNIVQISELFGDPAGRADALYLQGLIQARKEKTDDALRQFKEAEALYTDLGRRFDIARCLKEQGVLYLKSGNITIGRKVLTQAQTIFKELGSDIELKRISAHLKKV